MQDDDDLVDIGTKGGVPLRGSLESHLFRFRVGDDVMDGKFVVLPVGVKFFGEATEPSLTRWGQD